MAFEKTNVPPPAIRRLPAAVRLLEVARRYTRLNGQMDAVAVLRAMADEHPALLGEAIVAQLKAHRPYPEADTTPRKVEAALIDALRGLRGVPFGERSLLVALLRHEITSGQIAGVVSAESLDLLKQRLHADYSPEQDIVNHLKTVLAGQDAVLQQVAKALVQGLGDFRPKDKPRGVLFFAGPTGVGKTELARAICSIIDGDLVRFDCNALAGGGTENGRDALLWSLFGPVSGYKGSEDPAPFDGLEKKPDSVILFDEFEKAPRQLGSVLLQMLDQGEAVDTKQRKLNLRGCFFIMTSNAGVEVAPDTGSRFVGFMPHGNADSKPVTGRTLSGEPGRVTPESLKASLTAAGIAPEVMGRIRDWVIFSPMTHETLLAAVRSHLDRLCADYQSRHYQLEFAPGVIEAYVNRIGTGFGVRRVLDLLRDEVAGRLTRLDLLLRPPSASAPRRLAVRLASTDTAELGLLVELDTPTR